MAASVHGLREILFTVEPPKELINRADEMVLASQECLDILKNSSTDSGAQFYRKYLEESVSHFNFILAAYCLGSLLHDRPKMYN